MISTLTALALHQRMNVRLLAPGLLGTLSLACGLFGGDGSNQSRLEGDGLSEACQLVRSRGTINTGPLPEGCIKIEDDDLGREGLELEVGGGTVRITGWITKDGEDGEYIGFTYETDLAGGFLSVKAGLESYREAYDGEWIHPNGTSGPTASAISNIVFCEGEDPPPGGGGDAPDPGGDHPDPCYPEDGDGSPDPGGEGGGTPDDGSTDPGGEGGGTPDDGTTEGGGEPGGDDGSTDPGGDEGGACTHDDECDGNESCVAGTCIPAF